MDWDLVLKVGTAFKFDDKTFYDLVVGPRNRRAVVCGVGVMDKQYGFIWYYNPDNATTLTREDAAKVLVAQHGFSLQDHRAYLLQLGRLGKFGCDTKSVPGDLILDNVSNRGCSDREYAEAAAAV